MTDRTGTTGRLEVRRIYPHPPEAVFDAWTDAQAMRRWMRPGPTGDVRAELDVREGGTFRIDMIAGDRVLAHRGEYRVVERPRRLVFTWHADWIPGGSTVSIDFNEVEGGTEVVLVHEGLPSEESVANHTEGWGTILEKLGDALG